MNLTKATIISALVYLIPPSIFFILGWVDMQSGNWGTDDSGPIQGFVMLTTASIAGLIFICFSFPLIANMLKNKFSTRKWFWLNVASLLLFSFVISCIFSYFVGAEDLNSILVEASFGSVFFSIIELVLMAPAMFIWLRIAKRKL